MSNVLVVLAGPGTEVEYKSDQVGDMTGLFVSGS